jgi:hypothetical protein
MKALNKLALAALLAASAFARPCIPPNPPQASAEPQFYHQS